MPTDSATDSSGDCFAPAHFTASAQTVIGELAARYPGVPLLALGQTALWDEPTKATLRRLLDTLAPETPITVAAHDSDYFAKLPGHPSSAGASDYAVVPHDDIRTRGLWSAAGEMSAFFGGEDVPTQHEIEQKGGVSLAKVTPFVLDAAQFVSDLTTAWGWSGIIYTRWDKKIAADVSLREILPTLLSQIVSAFEQSANRLKKPERAADALALGETVCGWIETFAASHESASLTDLYADLLPRFYELLLGTPAQNLTVSSTAKLLRFNTQTAQEPRFAFVDLFLNPATRKSALDAYNTAVSGSGAYTLDGFGDGATPFDVVIPGRGRGTLAVLTDGTVRVLLPSETLTVCPPGQGCAPANVAELAKLLETRLGDSIALVGKAVALLPMLAAEYVFAFHEGASSYSDRSADMLDEMRRKKLPVPTVYPILRVQYATWDTLAAVPVEGGDARDAINLPPYLQQTLGRASIGFEDFALCWRRAISLAENDLLTLRNLRSPRELLAHLNEDGGEWETRERDYEAARLTLLGVHDRAQAIQGRVYTFYDQVRRLKTEALQTERDKGNDFRARIEPLRTKIAASANAAEIAAWQAAIEALQAERATTFDIEIESRRGNIRYALATIRELKQTRIAIERGTDAEAARLTLRRIEAEAEAAKAELVANSLRTLHALPHANNRPSAWWFPLVDPSGAWFSCLTATTELRWETL